ncbi:hypothetical protein Acr_00g0019620 [Actinidia rufa]|uniref:Uncharacterized protein n=1 Tax=Actinidia rufa TaxID=165716 RepID=A0A7J0DD67_9ERIC|nr:hypothetical protein Acr_00g0019620 [Actinidia rufa]
MILKVCPPGSSATGIRPRQWNGLIVVPWKIMSSLSDAELDVHYQLVCPCPQKFCNMKLLLYQIEFLFKAMNSPIDDNQSAASNECFVGTVLLMSDITDFYLLRSHNGYLIDD